MIKAANEQSHLNIPTQQNFIQKTQEKYQTRFGTNWPFSMINKQ